MSILTMLRAKKPETAAEIQQAREAVVAEHREVQSQIEQLEKLRDDLVLDGTEQQIDKADADLAIAERRLRDLDIARARLDERHAEATKRELRAEFERRGEAVARELTELPKIMADALHAAQTLVAAKAQWDGIESARVAHNQALDQVGLGELRVSGAFNDVVAAFEGKSEDHVRAGLTQLLNTMASLRGRVPAVAMLSPKGPKKR